MNILFVVPYTPTIIRTRPYNLLRGLRERGHTVTLATLWQNDAERDALRGFAADGIAVHAQHLSQRRTIRNSVRALAGGSPLQASYCWHPSLAAETRVLLNGGSPDSFDVVHVEHLRGVRYALNLKTLAPMVWDSVDCISHLFAQARDHALSVRTRMMTAVELSRTQKYEAWLTRQFDKILVTSAMDKQALDQLAAPQPSAVVVLSNGVDLDYFQPPSVPRHADTLVFSGKMSYHANVTAVLHFAREILTRIWQARPETRLWIVGQSPPPNVNALAADSRIQITGYVPDLRPHVSQATVAVCPVVYGAGVQNKVLEAMACATPVVSSHSGLSALTARIGADALVGDTPQDFAQQVLRLLDDAALAQRVGAAGRQYVERHHRWATIVQQLETIYSEVIETWHSRHWRRIR